MKCIAYDTALHFTGWAVIELDPNGSGDFSIGDYGVIETQREDAGDGEDIFAARLVKLHDEVLRVLNFHGDPADPLIAIEKTDWQPGASASRLQWIREASARWSLGSAFAVVYLAAYERQYKIRTVGALEWMRAVDSRNKDSTAAIIATVFPKKFSYELETQRSKKTRAGTLQTRVLRD